MSHNQSNFNFRANNFTTQYNYVPRSYVPSPPPPPLFYIPPTLPYTPIKESDEEYVKRFEVRPDIENKSKSKEISISAVREEMRKTVLILDNIKIKEKSLSENCNSMSDQEWKAGMVEIEQLKMDLNKFLVNINNNLKLDMLRKLVTKRSAKRLRLKRQRLERKKVKEDRIRKSQENSRKIDENLQKIKEDIDKVKQEMESKLQADIVLKEVLRKKSDAKKCLAKLDALMRLRKARQNTFKGRGWSVSERDAEVFTASIEKLKSLWIQKLTEYDKEEIELRDKLKQDSDQKELSNVKADHVGENLAKWREHLFGGELPQVDFSGDITKFVEVRSQWDKYISDDGSSLPIGWVMSTTRNT